VSYLPSAAAHPRSAEIRRELTRCPDRINRGTTGSIPIGVRREHLTMPTRRVSLWLTVASPTSTPWRTGRGYSPGTRQTSFSRPRLYGLYQQIMDLHPPLDRI
jgi:hypothetical protein